MALLIPQRQILQLYNLARNFVHDRSSSSPDQQEDGELCSVCSHIGLRKLAYADREILSPHNAVNLGSVSEIQQRAIHCKLCDFLWLKIRQHYGYNDLHQTFEGGKTKTFSLFHEGFFSLSRKEEDLKLGSDKHIRDIVIAETEEITVRGYHATPLVSLRPALSGTFHDRNPLRNEQLASDGFTNTVVGHGRLVRQLIDCAGFPRHWLDLCQSKHTQCAEAHPSVNTATVQVRWFRVVDVKERCITFAPPRCSYVALSYVWGGVEPPRLTLSNMSRLAQKYSLDEESDMPATIRDAMQLVERMHERYLWVDTLCIPQDDRKTKQSLMSQMHLIYLNATLTIVAAAGSNANAGLPGIRPNTRATHQETLILQDMTFITVINRYASQKLNESCWKKRGWTFEELLFSRRLLIFTDTQVFWHCAEAARREEAALEHWTPSAERVSAPQVISFEYEKMRELGPSPDLKFTTTYKRFIGAYCKRQLSHQYDKLNAFLGVQNALMAATGVKFYWGHPAIDFTRSLAWTMRGSRRNAEKMKIRGHGIAAADGNFPSWSWTGWHYPAAQPDTNEHLGFVHTPHAEITFYRLSTDHRLSKIVEHPEIHFLPGHDTFWPLGEGPKQSDWFGSPREIQNVVDLHPDDEFVDSGILRFWTRTATLTLERSNTRGGTSRGTQYEHYAVELDIPEARRPLPIQVSVEDIGCLDAGNGKLLVEAVALGRIWSFDTVCLLTHSKDGINYRLGIAIIPEQRWMMVSGDWRQVTLG